MNAAPSLDAGTILNAMQKTMNSGKPAAEPPAPAKEQEANAEPPAKEEGGAANEEPPKEGAEGPDEGAEGSDGKNEPAKIEDGKPTRDQYAADEKGLDKYTDDLAEWKAKNKHDYRRNGKLSRDNIELRRQIDELTSAVQNIQNGTSHGAAQPPNRDQFDTDEAYASALVKYEVSQQMAALQPAQGNRNAAPFPAEQAAEMRKTHPDFNEVMQDANDLRIPDALIPAFAEALSGSEYNAEIRYSLAKNSDEFDRLIEMTPIGVVKEIGKIEARLAASKGSAAPSKPKPKPPAPPASKSTPGGTKSLAEAKDMNEFMSTWTEQHNKRLKGG